MADYSKYEKLALELGATTVKSFDIDDICFDPRTILKCKYGCSDYGKTYNCPSDPKNLDIEQSIRIFKHYKGGIIVHSQDKATAQRVSYEIERQAFIDGYYFALSLSDCSHCKECLCRDGIPCPHEMTVRPAFHSVGIDVFKTVRQLGMYIATLENRNCEPNWYSAVFIE